MQKLKYTFRICIFLIILSLNGCGDSNDEVTLPSVSFGQASQAVNENDGTIIIKIISNEPLTNSIQLTLNIGGTAVEDEDYTINSTLSFTAGESEIDLELTLLNDGFISPPNGKTVVITLASNSQGVRIGTQDTFTLNITEDDLPTTITEGFGLDLTWKSGTRAVSSILNNSDVDLQLYYYGPNGASINRNTVTDASESNNQFEFIQGANSLADGVYGAWAFYRRRTSDITIDLDLSLSFTTASTINNYQVFTGSFVSSDANNSTSPVAENSYRELLRIRKTGTTYTVVPF